jgi:hypothetical protein
MSDLQGTVGSTDAATGDAVPTPTHVPFALLPRLLACDVVPVDRDWAVYTATAEPDYLHIDRSCAGRDAATEHVTAAGLVERLEWSDDTMCPVCGKGVENFGVVLSAADVDTLRNLDLTNDLLTNKVVVNAPILQAKSLLEISWAPGPEHANLVAHHEQLLRDMPGDLAHVRGSDRYRKELLKACLHGTSLVRKHADGERKGSPTRSEARTERLLGLLVEQEPAWLGDALPEPHTLDADVPLTVAEAALVEKLAPPWLWVALSRMDSDHLLGFAHDSLNASFHFLKIPALVAVTKPPRQGYFFALDQQATREEVVTAHGLVVYDDAIPAASVRLDEMIVAVRAANQGKAAVA